jgi:tRNA uridine 5-carbamoylmethylation protein Kti12
MLEKLKDRYEPPTAKQRWTFIDVLNVI